MLYCSCVWSGNYGDDDEDDDDDVTDSITFSYILAFHLPLGSFFMCHLNSINIYSFNSSLFMLCHEVLQWRVLSLVEEWGSFWSRPTLHIFISLGSKSARSWGCHERWGAASARTCTFLLGPSEQQMITFISCCNRELSVICCESLHQGSSEFHWWGHEQCRNWCIYFMNKSIMQEWIQISVRIYWRTRQFTSATDRRITD